MSGGSAHDGELGAGEVAVPAHLEQIAKQAPSIGTPAGVGAAAALGLRDRMAMEAPAGVHQKTLHIPNSFYELPALGEKLALKREDQK